MSIYRAPEAQKADSEVITLFDGTGSMSYEYESTVKAHQQVFNYLGNQKQDYQYAQQLQEGFLPFQCAGSGNITNAFQKIFDKLIEQQHSRLKNVCFIFLSDGEECFNLEALLPQIQTVKSVFQIMFVSVAVGKYFPHSISNDLRKTLHTQGDQVRSLYSVERNPEKSEDFVQQEFYNIFNQINQERKGCFYQQIFQLNKPVIVDILSEPKENIKPNETFIPINNNQQVIINGQEQSPSKNGMDIEDFIVKSVHKGLIHGNSQTYYELFDKIEDGISMIIQDFPWVVESAEENNKLLQTVVLVNAITKGYINLGNLSDQQKNTIQEGLFSEKVNLVQEVITLNQVQVQQQQQQIKADDMEKKLYENLNKITTSQFMRGQRIISIQSPEQLLKIEYKKPNESNFKQSSNY